METGKVVGLAFYFVLALVFATGGAQALAADGSPRLELEVTMEKQVRSVVDGKEVAKWEKADKVKPGEEVLFTITYKNTGTGEAKNASIVDPIPETMSYVPGSAEGEGAQITASIDGGGSYHAEPVKRTITNPDGSTEEVEAEPDMYTHIRWVVESVPPGASGTLTFRAKVDEK